MARMGLMIKKSANTAAIRAKADFVRDTEYCEFEGSDIGDVNVLLAKIDDENWATSESVTQIQGAQSDIKVPKKYVTG